MTKINEFFNADRFDFYCTRRKKMGQQKLVNFNSTVPVK